MTTKNTKFEGTFLQMELSQELRSENNVMDEIWYRNPSKSEVIGRCGGDEKTE